MGLNKQEQGPVRFYQNSCEYEIAKIKRQNSQEFSEDVQVSYSIFHVEGPTDENIIGVFL